MLRDRKLRGKIMRNKSLVIAQFGVLLSIEAIFCFTPLGSLPALGPIVMTLALIPVVITTIILGTEAGSLMGFFAGLFSFIVWTFVPPNPLVAFVFTPFYPLGEYTGNFLSVLICFVPRILVGTVTGITYTFLKKKWPEMKKTNVAISAILGSMTNTIGVLGGIWIFFGSIYSDLFGVAMLAIVTGLVLTNGIPEAILTAITSVALNRFIRKEENDNQ